jgi:threonyl-tRNA synthetase
MIIPIALKFADYVEEVKKEIHAAGFYVDADVSKLALNKKVREAQLAQYNFILVVGAEEMESRSVDVRSRDNKRHGKMTISKIIAQFKQLSDSYEMDPDLNLLVVDDKDEEAESASKPKSADEEDFL